MKWSSPEDLKMYMYKRRSFNRASGAVFDIGLHIFLLWNFNFGVEKPADKISTQYGGSKLTAMSLYTYHPFLAPLLWWHAVTGT